jgi:hypothetical protein
MIMAIVAIVAVAFVVGFLWSQSGGSGEGNSQRTVLIRIVAVLLLAAFAYGLFGLLGS